MPVSLIGTFIVLYAIGYSANSVSLLAVVLAIGIVVDDAIVVVENVERVMEEHPELSPGDATKLAMREITAPIIAITLVLLSVFVPIAFIPGISGELFRQFAVTVAVSMFISAINALTLSPALCGVFLKPHHGPRRGLIGKVMGAIDYVRDAYGAAVARIVRFSIIGLVLVGVAAFGTVRARPHHADRIPARGRSGRILRRGAVAGGASVERTAEVIRQAEAILKEEHAVEDVTSVVGLNFIDNYSQSNAGVHRGHARSRSRSARTARSAPPPSSTLSAPSSARSRAAQWSRCAPPPIIGLGTGGGFTYVLQDLAGGDPKALAQVVPRAHRRREPESGTEPRLHHVLGDQPFDLSRYRSRQGANLGVPLNSVFQALQASLGSYYVNDINLFGRTWQVQVQAEAADRATHRRHVSHQCALERRAR